MRTPLRQRKEARVVFDESHGEAWSIRPDAALADREFGVATHTGGSLAGAVLDEEFPLSAFYPTLQKKLADMAEAAGEPAHV